MQIKGQSIGNLGIQQLKEDIVEKRSTPEKRFSTFLTAQSIPMAGPLRPCAFGVISLKSGGYNLLIGKAKNYFKFERICKVQINFSLLFFKTVQNKMDLNIRKIK